MLLEAIDLQRHHATRREVVRALDGVSFCVAEREVVALIGPSGSGKSTLLHLLAGIDRPTGGRLLHAGRDLGTLSASELATYRRRHVGLVFQSFHLIARMTALENVELPLILDGIGPDARRRRAADLLAQVGLDGRLEHRPAELSGGEQQRVAIARALASSDSLILADEPTGNLDSRRSAEILALLLGLRDQGRTLILVTHDPEVARAADRQIHLRDGRLVEAVDVQQEPA